ncbi:AraC family transcriptional regulator [Sphingobacterium suaedae]|uniref:Helix-turn-helix domain-containing protein n=1 Tax=Sphingobacterium suaedae TaxID=1686402 RepID=A0ABW5KJC4_9SPHI
MSRNRFQLDFMLLHVGYAEHDGDWNFQNINSPFARLHIVTEGCAQIIKGNESVLLKKGHMYLTPSYTHHGYACDGPFSLFYIHIYENPDKKNSVFDRISFPTEVPCSPLLLDLVHRLFDINPGRALSYYDPKAYDTTSELMKSIALHINTPLALEIESQGIINQLLSRFLPEATDRIPHVDERLLRVLDYIHENLHTPISIDDLAALSYLTKDHLIRLFKKQMNCTPGKYINRKKIEKAQLLMLIENPSIQELSFRLGFEHVSYFNRLFKKMTGENPSAHKKRMLGSSAKNYLS